MALPLHPRRASLYFQTILGRVSDIHARVAAFQRFYLVSLQACKVGAPCLLFRDEDSDGIPSSAFISAHGQTLEIQHDGTVDTIHLGEVEYVVCSSNADGTLRCRIHHRCSQVSLEFCTTNVQCNQQHDDEFTFAQWVLVVVCTATALRQDVQDKSTQLLWQAARLRVVELTCLLGINPTFTETSRHLECISFLEAIQDTQRVLHDIAANDVSVDLGRCWFLRVQPHQLNE